MLKFGKKEFKRIFSILLSVMLAAGCFAGLSLTADAVSATDSHAVYADDFSNAAIGVGFLTKPANHSILLQSQTAQ